MLAAALALALGLAASSQPAVEGTEVERVVAVVRAPGSSEATVITLTRLEAESRVALITRGATLAATQPLDGPALRAGLDWLVDEVLLAAEAARLQVFEVDAVEREAELARFRARLSAATYAAFLARADLSEEELGAVLGRMLRVRRYVESRVTHAGQASESELSSWLDEHAAALGTRDRDVARAQLAQRRVADEVAALLRDVRARAEVRLLGGLPAGPAPASSVAGSDHEVRRQARR
ncbi:MAG TPA: hypothetical protein VF341_03095 [Anaeromyxobacteraceae bacterium]